MEGFDFDFDAGACDDCPGFCCCGESGYVWINQMEMQQIAAFLKMSPVDFKERYSYRIGNRISLKERAVGDEYACIFFENDTKKCAIYAVRPGQCRQYPFWGRFKKNMEEVIEECPGVTLKSDKP